jgi:hypothetical protein
LACPIHCFTDCSLKDHIDYSIDCLAKSSIACLVNSFIESFTLSFNSSIFIASLILSETNQSGENDGVTRCDAIPGVTSSCAKTIYSRVQLSDRTGREACGHEERCQHTHQCADNLKQSRKIHSRVSSPRCNDGSSCKASSIRRSTSGNLARTKGVPTHRK